MIRKIEDFTSGWKLESEKTEKLLQALTDESLAAAVSEGHRTIGRIAWHIAQTIPEMGGRTGLKLDGPGEKDPVPTCAAEIVKAYHSAAQSLLEQVSANWQDETLQVEDDLYGMTWKRGLTVAALINHEVHHRGQLTVLMRQAGLKVTGIYGPAKEEWDAYNMPAPEI